MRPSFLIAKRLGVTEARALHLCDRALVSADLRTRLEELAAVEFAVPYPIKATSAECNRDFIALWGERRRRRAS